MKVSEFCKKYGIPPERSSQIVKFISDNPGLGIKKTFASGYKIEPKDEERLLIAWNPHEAKYQILADRQKEMAQIGKRPDPKAIDPILQQEEEEIAAIVKAMPITSTQSFDGYRIVEYGGYVSGDEAIELSDVYFMAGDFNKDIINNEIKAIRIVAINELKTAAAQIGCNAVVGLDFDYITIDRQLAGPDGIAVSRSFLILTANGTAVTIEPI